MLGGWGTESSSEWRVSVAGDGESGGWAAETIQVRRLSFGRTERV